MLNQVQHDRMRESGRSFLEMLGLLAVMGLISITGLMGYTYAMKRVMVNELLNEANKRAVLIASQLMVRQNPEDITIPESSTPYGSFSDSVEIQGDKFKIGLSDLKEDVCRLMKNLAGGPIRRLACNSDGTSYTADMYFNEDLSIEVIFYPHLPRDSAN